MTKQTATLDIQVKSGGAASAFNTIARGFKTMAAGMREQASSLRDLGKSAKEADKIDKVASVIEKIASMTGSAAGQLASVARSAVDLGESSSKAAVGTHKLNHAMDESLKSSSKLKESSDKVAKGIKKVGDENDAAEVKVSKFSKAIKKLSSSFKTFLTYSIVSSVINGVRNSMSQATDTIIDYDQALHDLQAITRATSAEVALMDETISKVAKDTKFSLDETAAGMKTLGQAGFSVTESIGSMPAIANLATATLTPMAKAVDLTTTALRVFNKQPSETAHVADVFMNAVNGSKLSVEKLATSFNYVAPVARIANVSFEDLTATMMMLANHGIRASTIGTGLRQVFSKIVKPTREFRDAVNDAGMTMDDLNPKYNTMNDVIGNLSKVVVDAEDAFRFFGMRGSAAIAALVQGSSQDFEDMKLKVMATGTAAEGASTQLEGLGLIYKNVADKVGVLQKSMGDAGLTSVMRLFGKALQRTLDLMIEWSDSAVGKVIGAVVVLSGVIAGLVATYTALAALFTSSAVTTAVSALTATLVSLGGGALTAEISMEGATVATTTFGAALLDVAAGPIGWAVGALSLLAGAVYFFTKSTGSSIKEIDKSITKYAELKTKLVGLKSELDTIKDSTASASAKQEASNAIQSRLIEQVPELSIEILKLGTSYEGLAAGIELANQHQNEEAVSASIKKMQLLSKEVNEAEIAGAKAANKLNGIVEENSAKRKYLAALGDQDAIDSGARRVAELKSQYDEEQGNYETLLSSLVAMKKDVESKGGQSDLLKLGFSQSVIADIKKLEDIEAKASKRSLLNAKDREKRLISISAKSAKLRANIGEERRSNEAVALGKEATDYIGYIDSISNYIKTHAKELSPTSVRGKEFDAELKELKEGQKISIRGSKAHLESILKQEDFFAKQILRDNERKDALLVAQDKVTLEKRKNALLKYSADQISAVGADKKKVLAYKKSETEAIANFEVATAKASVLRKLAVYQALKDSGNTYRAESIQAETELRGQLEVLNGKDLAAALKSAQSLKKSRDAINKEKEQAFKTAIKNNETSRKITLKGIEEERNRTNGSIKQSKLDSAAAIANSTALLKIILEQQQAFYEINGEHAKAEKVGTKILELESSSLKALGLINEAKKIDIELSARSAKAERDLALLRSQNAAKAMKAGSTRVSAEAANRLQALKNQQADLKDTPVADADLKKKREQDEQALTDKITESKKQGLRDVSMAQYQELGNWVEKEKLTTDEIKLIYDQLYDGMLIDGAQYAEGTRKYFGTAAQIVDLKYREMEHSAKRSAQLMSEAIDITTDGLTEGITQATLDWEDGTKSMGESFSSMAISIVKDIERMILKAIVFAAIQKALGFISSTFAPTESPVGVDTSLGDTPFTVHSGKSARNWGNVSRKLSGLQVPVKHAGVGPDGRLTIIRKNEEVRTPAQQKQNGNQIVINNVVNVPVDNAKDQQGAEQYGNVVASLMETKIMQTLIAQKRPGGILSPA